MANLSRYAFVFDFDGPIFDGRRAAEEALALTFDKFEAVLGRPRIQFQAVPLFNPERLIQLFYAGMWNGLANPQEVLDYYQGELESIEKGMFVNGEVRDMLDVLSARFKLAVLSSRKGGELRDRIRRMGLESFFQVICGSDDLQSAKPDPAALEELGGKLQIEPGCIVMVGDNDWDFLCTQRENGKRAVYYHAAWSMEPSSQARNGAAAILKSPSDLTSSFKNYRELPVSAPAHPPDQLKKAIRNGDLVFYAGAGVSVTSGFGGWNDHYLPILRELGVSFLTQQDWELTDVLQLAAADADRRKPLFDLFRDSFKKNATPNAYHRAMLRSKARRIWTSNYDRLFENANATAEFGWTIVFDDKDLMNNYREPKILIKMNGDFESASFDDKDLTWDLTFTQAQFDVAELERREIWRLFEDDYRGRCVVFVGCSMRDPALRRIVTVARQKIRRTNYQHYLLMRRGGHPLEEVAQSLFAENLAKQNIQVLFLEGFPETETLVTHLSRDSYRPIIGFSGNFGDLLKPNDEMDAFANVTLAGGLANAAMVAEFCGTLAKGLAARGFRVTSGCAPGVGIPAVSAAFEVDPGLARFYIRKYGGTRYNRTAPAVVVKSEHPNDAYGPMRRRMIPEQSLLIAMAGLAYGENSPGTITEIEMALDLQIPVLLVPQAGGDVAGYRDHFMASIETRYPDQDLAKAIRSLNEEVAGMAADDLEPFAANQLITKIEGLLATLMGSGLPWHFRDPQVREASKW